MTNPSNPANDFGLPSGEPLVADRVQELTWAMVDEQITDDETRLLDNLLLSDDGARDAYIGCIELHVDLMQHFSALATTSEDADAGSSPVLGFLSDAATPFGSHPPTPEDSRS